MYEGTQQTLDLHARTHAHARYTPAHIHKHTHTHTHTRTNHTHTDTHTHFLSPTHISHDDRTQRFPKGGNHYQTGGDGV